MTFVAALSPFAGKIVTSAELAAITAPSDGQVVILALDPTNDVFWRLRYTASTNKWVFQGGNPVRVVADGTDSDGPTGATPSGIWRSPGGFATMATLPMPRDGDYRYVIGAAIDSGNNVDGAVGIAVRANAVTAVDANAAFNNNFRGSGVIRVRTLTLSAADTLSVQYRNDKPSNTSTWTRRYLEVLPIRLAGV